MATKKILAPVFFLALPFFCRAQTANIHLYSIEEGIPQSQVHCVLQDKKGFLWFGTDGGGLVRYDGKKFSVFTISEGLCYDGVYCLGEDEQERLWAGTPKGISIYQTKKFLPLPPELKPLSGLFIRSMLVVSSSEIYFGTNQGAFVYDGNVLHEIPGLKGKTILSVYKDKQGNIWMGTSGDGIFMEKNNIIVKKYSTANGLRSNAVNCFLQDENKTFAGTSAGINVIEGEKISFLALPAPPLAKQIIQSIKTDSRKNIWVCTLDAGVYKISKDTVVKFGSREGLSVDGAYSSFEDREGNIWFGTDGAGAAKLGEQTFTSLRAQNGLPSEMILSLCKTKKGERWFGHDNGATFFDGKKFSFFNSKNGFADEKVWRIIEDKDGNIWLTTTGSGIFKYANGKFTNYNEKNGLSNNYVRVLFSDYKGRIWVGTGNGLNLFDGKTFRIFSTKDGLANARFLCAYEDKKNNLWFGTSGGGISLVKEENGKFSFRNFTEADGLAGNGSLCIAEDSAGNIWSANFDGISRINPVTREIKTITKKDGLASNTVYAIAATDDNHLLIGTNSGIDKLDLAEYYRTGKIATKHFGSEEGFFGTECNTGSVLKEENGNTWFGTIRGAFCYHPSEDKTNPVEPQTEITNVRLSFENFDFATYSDSLSPRLFLPARMVFPYNKNHLTFDFAGLSFSIPKKVQYKYKLEGFDKDWTEPMKENFATYSNLPPGKFTFNVMSCNNDGIWSAPATFSFQITPPFWATWWFRISVLCTILLGIYAVFKWRLSRLRAMKKYLEEQVDLKTKELRAEKELVEVQNKVIEKKNQNITASIRYAKRIQESILPLKEKIQEVIPESFILFKPKDIVSGDFYWFARMNGTSLVAAVDCTGHGVPGAFMSLIGNNLLNDIVNNKKITDPEIILHQLHEGVVSALKKQEHETGTVDGMDIALCAIDHKNQKLEFASSGRPLLLAGETGIKNVKKGNHPVGLVTKKEASFRKETIQLSKGDAVYIFTDGYCDQFGGPQDEKFMQTQLEELLLSIRHKPMREQEKILDEKLAAWKGSNSQLDDVLVIGMRINS
ncbi:MAG: SpoIIE family protein phosphatase [Bacteroidetes bacterium]|nr:SpoIIE family protein phosphatase [Bacteroidota bacterium]